MTARFRLETLLLLAAIPLLVAGLVLPAISVTSLGIFEQTFSLSEGVARLAREHEYALFALVFFFTLAFPIVKIFVGLAACTLANTHPVTFRRLLKVIAALSKWSMLDVFVVALLVLIVDGNVLSSADVRSGALLFAAAILLSTFAIYRLQVRQ